MSTARTERPSDPAIDSPRSRVEAQKQTILRALSARQYAHARRLATELAAAQELEGRADLAAKSLCHLAKQAERMGEFEIAESWLDAALTHAPNDPISWSQRVTLMRKQGRKEERHAWAEHMVERFPGSHVALSARASSLRSSGQLEEALGLYDRIIEEVPNDPFPRNGRAALYRRMGRLDLAQAAYEETARICEDDEFALTGVGSVMRARGDYDGALATFERAIQRFPTSPASYLRKGEALSLLGRLPAALAVFDDAVSRFPFDAGASRGRGRVLLALGRRGEALIESARLASGTETHVSQRAGRAEVLKELGRLDEAAVVYRSIQRRGYLDSYARVAFGLVLMRLRQDEMVRVLCASGWDPLRQPGSASEWLLYLTRGMAFLRRGDARLANTLFTNATSSPFIEMRARAHHALALSAIVCADRPAASASLAAAAAESTRPAAIEGARAVLRAIASDTWGSLASQLESNPLRYSAFVWIRRHLKKQPSGIRLSAAFIDALVEVILH